MSELSPGAREFEREASGSPDGADLPGLSQQARPKESSENPHRTQRPLRILKSGARAHACRVDTHVDTTVLPRTRSRYRLARSITSRYSSISTSRSLQGNSSEPSSLKLPSHSITCKSDQASEYSRIFSSG